jgi:uncharacterized repeat protein (TIGR01451 family)
VLTVSVGAAAYPSATNRAWVSGGGDVFAANNSDATVAVVNAPDLTISTSVSPGTFSQGSNGVYTVSITNAGTAATSGTITVRDTLPTGMTYVIATGTNWTFNVTGNVVVGTNATALAVNGVSTFTLAGKPGAASVPVITNKIVVSGGNEVNVANDTSFTTTNVSGTTVVVDLVVSVSASANFQQNYTGTYTVTVSSLGSASSGGTITVVDTLPTGLTYNSSAGSGWTINAVGRVVTATYTASIASGGSAAFTITTNVGVAAIPSVTDRAWVSGGGDANAANNGSGDVTTTVSGFPSVTVLASSSPSTTATPGQIITYTYNFVNGGNGAAVSVTITSNLSSQVQFVLGSLTSSLPGGVTATVEYSNGSVWTYTPVSGGCGAAAGYDNCVTTVRWTLQPQLAAGASGNVSVGARVK